MKRIISLCAVVALFSGTAFAEAPAVAKESEKPAAAKVEPAPASEAPKTDTAVAAEKSDEKPAAGTVVEEKATTPENAKPEKK